MYILYIIYNIVHDCSNYCILIKKKKIVYYLMCDVLNECSFGCSLSIVSVVGGQVSQQLGEAERGGGPGAAGIIIIRK